MQAKMKMKKRAVGQVQAIHERHFYVGKEEVYALLEQQMTGVDGVFGQQHLVAGTGEVQAQKLPHMPVVVHDQNRRAHGRDCKRREP